MKTCFISVVIGLLAAVFSLTETGTNLEHEWGLAWLFNLRGPVQAPPEITIVSIDKISADILRLPEDPEKWPRTYHAELIRKINQQEPALIGFNLYFGETRYKDLDEYLAKAMSDKRNVVLSNYLKQFVSPHGGFLKHLRYEHIVDPAPLFADEALAIAPFPLPKTASTVKQFWTYRRNAGDIATFPAAIFLSYLIEQAYPEILQILRQSDPDFAAQFPEKYERRTKHLNEMEFFQQIRLRWLKNPEKFSNIDRIIGSLPGNPHNKQLLKAWVALLKGNDNFFINHYGKAGSITTIPFYQVLVSEIINPAMFHNKIVLIGYSEDIEPEKNQGFYTVFSETNGETVSAIEIAATAVANLLENSGIQPLSLWHQFFLMLGWSFLLSIVCRLLSYRFTLFVIVALVSVYIGVAYYLFTALYLWIPVLFPVFALAPVFLILASIKHYQRKKQEHRKVYRTFSQYLPDGVVDSLVSHPEHEEMGGYGRLVDGVCMASDAGQYTTLSETMCPQQLKELMNRYYGVIFPQVTKSNGFISDVIGDAMLAIWSDDKSVVDARLNACNAALQIKEAVARFNANQNYQLPTRLGLHYGSIHLGNVGAADHYEYRAVGDIVNTATRIEGLNKLLGTKILVSSTVIDNLPDLSNREIGLFILKGKTLPIKIHELIAENHPSEDFWSTLCSAFADALALFKQQQWLQALEAFRNIAEEYPEDGPTLFYINYLQNNLSTYSEQTIDDISVIEIGNITTALL